MKTIRIGCGAGFWGDSAGGPAQLVNDGEIDFLVLDYLAEITMSILARTRQKRPDAGYATDFVDAVMAPLARAIADKKIKVIANAGGVNPAGCRDALTRVLGKLGVDLKVAIVLGDDVRDILPSESRPATMVSANAYLGAAPIAAALRAGADIVITGRCVDSALVLGPLLATFDWQLTDWDLLSAGSLAGHVIECGTQVTGGVFTDWREVEAGWSNMGFPIVECAADGSFVVTKPAGTGGLVSTATVAEQLVYEVHDPVRYLLADVVCDWSNVRLTSLGDDRVRVTGARGEPATDTYKVSVTFADGYRAGATLLIVGHEARAKAERVGAAILQRVRRMIGALGMADFRDTSIEVFGPESSFGAHAAVGAAATREVLLKVAVAHDDERALEIFAREIAPAATAMAQSISGFAGGRPRVQPIVRLASMLVSKASVIAKVELDGASIPVAAVVARDATFMRQKLAEEVATVPMPHTGETIAVPLRVLAHGRSGDKGDTSNIGVIARDARYLPFLRAQLTAAAVQKWFAHFVRGEVRRYEWPGLNAFNFVLEEALGGGGIASLRMDPQGKGFAQNLLETMIEMPIEWVDAEGKIR